MKQLFKYFLALAITFLAGYFVFNEFLSEPGAVTVPTTVTVDKNKSSKTEFSLHEFYTNPLNGIKMDFPEGFEGHEWGVSFGPLVQVPEAPEGRLGHQYEMRFTEARTLAETETAVKTDDLTEFVDSDLFGNFTIVEYIESGLCSYPTIEIIGFKNNYKFSPICSDGNEADVDYMKKIIETGSLIPDHLDEKWEYCENQGGQYEVYVGDEKTFENCMINDGLDGIRCEMGQYFRKECGHS